jgi:hypothetical protein
LKLENLTSESKVRGVILGEPVTVVHVQWIGSDAVELTYNQPNGITESRLLYRENEPGLSLVEPGLIWGFQADGDLFRLASEAHRIRLAYLFDPLLAVHTSVIDPLPHQITGVYEKMLPRQPLRFLLADDPGAGKTFVRHAFKDKVWEATL